MINLKEELHKVEKEIQILSRLKVASKFHKMHLENLRKKYNGLIGEILREAYKEEPNERSAGSK